MPTHIMLIPGFFGFTSLGQVGYFRHVDTVLRAALAEAGQPATIHRLAVGPTASLPRRAARVASQILGKTSPNDQVVLIGHSTGGLDARVLVTPGVRLPGIADPSQAARRVKAVVSVCTPHYGTPIADDFTSLPGQRALEVLSLSTLALLRLGPLPPKLIGRMARLLSGGQSLVEQVHRELLAGLDDTQADEVRAFMREVHADTTLLHQLRPASVELLKMTLRTPDHVAEGCVVAATPRPGAATVRSQGWSAGNQASHLVFVALRKAAGRLDERYLSAVPQAARERLARQGELFARPG